MSKPSVLNLFRKTHQSLQTPHVLIGSNLAVALALLESCGWELSPFDGDLAGYEAISKQGAMIIYAAADEVDSVWYDDPVGRGIFESKLAKVHLYLSRYGTLADWELRLDNGWMRYWFNPKAHVAMVYGVHKDVIRFNKYDGD